MGDKEGEVPPVKQPNVAATTCIPNPITAAITNAMERESRAIDNGGSIGDGDLRGRHAQVVLGGPRKARSRSRGEGEGRSSDSSGRRETHDATPMEWNRQNVRGAETETETVASHSERPKTSGGSSGGSDGLGAAREGFIGGSRSSSGRGGGRSRRESDGGGRYGGGDREGGGGPVVAAEGDSGYFTSLLHLADAGVRLEQRRHAHGGRGGTGEVIKAGDVVVKTVAGTKHSFQSPDATAVATASEGEQQISAADRAAAALPPTPSASAVPVGFPGDVSDDVGQAQKRRGRGPNRVRETDEEREAKRLKRVQANRESARLTIQRKHEQYDDLNGKSGELERGNQALRCEMTAAYNHMQALAVENARLRDEIRAAAAEKGLMVPDMEEGIMAAAAAAAAAVAAVVGSGGALLLDISAPGQQQQQGNQQGKRGAGGRGCELQGAPQPFHCHPQPPPGHPTTASATTTPGRGPGSFTHMSVSPHAYGKAVAAPTQHLCDAVPPPVSFEALPQPGGARMPSGGSSATPRAAAPDGGPGDLGSSPRAIAAGGQMLLTVVPVSSATAAAAAAAGAGRAAAAVARQQRSQHRISRRLKEPKDPGPGATTAVDGVGARSTC